MTSSRADARTPAAVPAAAVPAAANPWRLSPVQLRRLQLAQLGIADAVAALCDAHGIGYVLLGGSALGARRHQGFIPWDDDMDIGMLRADFERFLAVSRHHLPGRLYVQHWLSDPHMGVPFAKVRLNGTRLVEEGSRDCGGHKGIAIDIFPFDNLPAGPVRALWLVELKLLKRVLRLASGYTVRRLSLPALLADLPLRWLARRLAPATIKRRLDRVMRRYADRPSARVLAVGGAYDFSRDRLERRWLTERRSREFEGRRFACPAEIDAYLAHMYGDFLALPPPGERTGRHALLELDFGTATRPPAGNASAPPVRASAAVCEMEGHHG